MRATPARRLSRALFLGLALASGRGVLGEETAHAKEPTADELDRARTFFDAGAQAYGAARYADAVRAFEQALSLAPRPQIVFSLAQAERKEYFVGGDPRVLRAAIRHYKEYLDAVPSGGRRSDATEARADLEARLARLDPQQAGGQAAPTAPPARRARVTVVSPTPGARASLDGGALQETPLFAELEPGRHVIRVAADGHFDAVQEVSGDKPGDIPLNIELKEKPALVSVALEASGELFVDGRVVATTPLRRPVEVQPGVHVVSVRVNGKRAWSQEVTLARASSSRLEPRLETSAQRAGAVVALGAGAVSVATGALLGLGALANESRARDIEAARAAGNISAQDLVEHNDAVERRDAMRTASLVTLSVGGVLLVSGALLYALDQPTVAVVPPRATEPPKPRREPGLELTACPLLAPASWGGVLVGRF